MTYSWRSLTLLACLPLALFACGDDDDDSTNTGGSGGGAGNATAGGGGSAGATTQPLDWDTYCTKEEAQYQACPSATYAGCTTRCFESYKGAPARVAVLQQCLLARSCDQINSDNDCSSTASFSDPAKTKPLFDACVTILHQCNDPALRLFDDESGDDDSCNTYYSELVDPTLAAPIQQCLANHKDCATTAACLKDPVAQLRADHDQENACQEKITSPTK